MLQASIPNSRVNKLVLDALHSSLKSQRHDQRRHNYISLQVTLDAELQAETDYCISLLKEALIDLCIDRAIDEEFVALVEVRAKHVGIGPLQRIKSRFRMDHDVDVQDSILEVFGTAQTLPISQIERIIAGEQNRIANGMAWVIRYPDTYIELVDDSGTRTRISRQTTIGRSAERGMLVVDDANVSAHHAVLSVNREGTWYIIDNASLNGTKLNDYIVTSAMPLHEGDVITLANTTCLKVDVIRSIHDEPKDKDSADQHTPAHMAAAPHEGEEDDRPSEGSVPSSGRQQTNDIHAQGTIELERKQ